MAGIHLHAVPIARRYALTLVGVLLGAAPVVAASPAESGSLPPATAGSSSQVIDTHGRPVPGVAILFQTSPRVLVPEKVSATTVTVTDAAGRFSLPGEPGEEGRIVLEKAGLNTIAFLGAGSLPPLIRMESAVNLTGYVKGPGGKPLEGALVGPVQLPLGCDHPPQPGHPEALPPRFARTDAAGQFVFEGLYPHRYVIPVSASGFETQVLRVEEGATSAGITLREGGITITGSVIGSRSRALKPGAWVEAVGPSLHLFAKTGEDGRFLLEGLPPDEWMLEALDEKRDRRSESFAVELRPDMTILETSLVLNEGIRVAGTAMDTDTSRPIAGLKLKVKGPYRESSGETDEAGAFVFEDQDAFGDLLLRFDESDWALAGHFTSEGQKGGIVLDAQKGQDLTTVTLVLRRRPRISGRVVDVLGRPVAQAAVVLRGYSGDGSRSAEGSETEPMPKTPPQFSATSDPEGAFECSVYPPGVFEAIASAPQGISAPIQVEAASTATEKIELRLGAPFNLYGAVVTAEDEAVTGALVTAVPTDSRTAQTTSARTAENGSFEFLGLAPRPMRLRATHPEFASAVKTEVIPGGTSASQAITLRFPGGGEFAALVSDSADKPVAEAEVVMYYSEGLEGKVVTRRSDAQGKVRIRGIPAPHLERVRASSKGYIPSELTQIALPAQDVVLRLERRGSIQVRLNPVPDEATAGASQVWLLRSATPAGTADRKTAPPEAESYTGILSAPPTGGMAEFQELEPGWYKAAFKSGSRYAESEPLQLDRDGASRQIDLEISGEATVTGRVRDKQTGKALEGVLVTVAPATGAQFGLAPVAAVTTSDGSYSLRGIPAGETRVTATKAPYGDQVRTARVTAGQKVTLDLELSQAAGQLTGSVRVGRSPVESALLILHDPSAAEGAVATALSNTQGEYTMGDIPPGRYNLTVEAPLGSGETVRQRSYEVTIQEGTTRKDIEFRPPVQVSGTIRVGGKAADPAQGASSLLFSSAEGGGGVIVPVGEDATFSTELEPGTYTVGLEDRPGKTFQIPASAPEYRLNLDF